MALEKSEAVVRNIKRRTRRKYTAEGENTIALEDFCGDANVSAICKMEGIAPNQYYHWIKDLREVGKKRLIGDTMRKVNGNEVTALGNEIKHPRAREAFSVRVLPIPGSQI